MTDRHSGYIVVLEGNIREDDAQSTIAAIKHIKGVLDVKPVIAGYEQEIGVERENHRLRNKIFEIFRKDFA